MNDNISSITTLINNQLVLMNTYHRNVHNSMQNISNSIQELIQLQEARDMEDRIMRRRSVNLDTNTSYYRNYVDDNIENITRNLNRINRNIRQIDRENVLDRRSQSQTRNTRNRITPSRPNTSPFFYSTTRAPSVRRNRLNHRNLSGRPSMNRRRRRMTLQEFINSTLNQGNPRIPADSNRIMQETSIVHFQDLSGTSITTCPISLRQFDVSSNILRINTCNHVFEAASLMRWFREDSRCPLCRYNINTDTNENSRDTSQNNTDTNENIEERQPTETEDIEDQQEESENISNALVYDISFSIPQLFGRDMSENQINDVIDSITNTITRAMNNQLSTYTHSLGDGEEVVVEEMIIEQVENGDVENEDVDNEVQNDIEDEHEVEDEAREADQNI